MPTITQHCIGGKGVDDSENDGYLGNLSQPASVNEPISILEFISKAGSNEMQAIASFKF